MKQSQNRKLIEWLKKGHNLTNQFAFSKFNITRLGGRIYELKKQGIVLNEKWEGEGREQYKVWSLAKYAKR